MHVCVCLPGKEDIVCHSPAPSKCTFLGIGLGISMATAKPEKGGKEDVGGGWGENGIR